MRDKNKIKSIIIMVFIVFMSFSFISAYSQIPEESEFEGSYEIGYILRRDFTFAWQLAMPLDQYKADVYIPIVFGMGIGPNEASTDFSYNFADYFDPDVPLYHPKNGVWGEHIEQSYALMFDQKQFYKDNKQIHPQFQAFDSFGFPNRDEYRQTYITDKDPFSFFDFGYRSLLYKEDVDTVNPLLKHADISGARNSKDYNFPYPWVVETVYLDCGNGDPIQEFRPMEYQPNGGDIGGVGGTYNPNSIYPNKPGARNINYQTSVQQFINAFECKFPESMEGEKPQITIDVKVRKNRLYVLMEEFLKDEYVDDEFTTAIANPYQILQNDNINCEKSDDYFFTLGGTEEDPRYLPAIGGTPLQLNDEICYTSYTSTLPTLVLTDSEYNETEFMNDTNTTSLNSDHVPDTNIDSTEVVDFEEYLRKQIKYNDLRQNIQEKNNVLTSLVDICYILFSVILVFFYIIEMVILVYIFKKWIPQVINIYRDLLKKIKEKLK